jgi:NADH-quinone oxidoreductase subunit L
VPPLAGFFSKDEILASVFARTHGSTLAEASWLGISGSTILYVVYAFGLIAALLTAIYMTRMMLYTFHGPNRTGERERAHLAEAPWIMTGPLVVLGLLTVIGGAINLPAFLGLGDRAQALHHWLEPVTGAAALAITHGAEAHLALGTELVLVALAVVIAVAGIALAVVRLRPGRLVAKAQAPEAHGIERLLEHKYYVDEIYDAAIVQPIRVASQEGLWRGFDVKIIDGAVNGTATIVNSSAAWLRRLQTGSVKTYAGSLFVGVVAILAYYIWRL